MQPIWRKRLLAFVLVPGSLIGATVVVLGTYVTWATSLSGEVVNSTDRLAEEVIVRAGSDEARLLALAPGERRHFSFTASHEGSLTVHARLASDRTASRDCETYLDAFVRRAEFQVEHVAVTTLLVHCTKRSVELKF